MAKNNKLYNKWIDICFLYTATQTDTYCNYLAARSTIQQTTHDTPVDSRLSTLCDGDDITTVGTTVELI